MRLIDEDSLSREMYRKSFEVDDGRHKWDSGLWIRYKIYEESIRDAQTVDAMPVRHGRWIRDDFGAMCGVCGLYAYRDKFDQPWESPYCPICGAKMDERKECS